MQQASLQASVKESNYRRHISEFAEKGKKYLEVVRNGSKIVYRCAACRIVFETKKALVEHLKEKNHELSVKFVDATIQKAEPWPFNDGRLFLHNPNSDLIVPQVMYYGQIKDLKANIVGYGKVMVRMKSEGKGISQIWCEWSNKDEVSDVKEHDFGIITFASSHTLGRYLTLDEFLDVGQNNGSTKLQASELKAKANNVGRECTVCEGEITLGSDVGTLFNKDTGKLACGTRNVKTRRFHLYHLSCLIDWILLRECKKYYDETQPSVFCPECWGTGTGARFNDSQKLPATRLDKVQECRDDIREAYKEWRKNPELVDKSSIGLHFKNSPLQEGPVSPWCSLTIYRALPSG